MRLRKHTNVSGLRRIAEDGRSSVRGGNTWDGIEVSGNFRGVGWMEQKIGENRGGCCGG